LENHCENQLRKRVSSKSTPIASVRGAAGEQKKHSVSRRTIAGKRPAGKRKLKKNEKTKKKRAGKRKGLVEPLKRGKRPHKLSGITRL